ncbi:MAG: hypothetical protein U5P10_00260 [Spirochaetia bacterium]|nr:hypothetical protein [Spirochaetia bacterium]
MKSEGQKRPPVPYALILLALVVCAGITFAIFFSFRNYADEYRLAVENDLRSIANLKVDELVQWRKERAGDAEVFFRNELFIAALQRYYEDPKDREQLYALRSWLFRVREAYGYSGIGLFDRHGNPIVGYSETVPWTHLKTNIADALKQNAARFIDFHRAEGDGAILLSVLAPIYADKEFTEELAVLVLQIRSVSLPLSPNTELAGGERDCGNPSTAHRWGGCALLEQGPLYGGSPFRAAAALSTDWYAIGSGGGGP